MKSLGMALVVLGVIAGLILAPESAGPGVFLIGTFGLLAIAFGGNRR